MSMMVSFFAVLFPWDVLDEILNLIESVSEVFPTYSLLTGVKLYDSTFSYYIRINMVTGFVAV